LAQIIVQNYILIMMSSFSDYLNKREWYGGEPGAESMASDQADQFGSSVRTTAMQQYGDDDKPITSKNRKNKISFMKKDCNCKDKKKKD